METFVLTFKSVDEGDFVQQAVIRELFLRHDSRYSRYVVWKQNEKTKNCSI